MHRVAVLGATGYAGRELVQLLLQHPRIELVAAASRQDGGRLLSELMPGAPDQLLVPLDEVPLEVLEQNNAMSLLGLHRRLRGAALGHLAAFEATSSMPSRRMAQGLERLGFPAEIVGYYTEHVEADAVHEQLAARTICGRLVELEPALADEVFFGAFTCLDLEDRFARWMLAQWGASSEGSAA